MLRFSNLAVLFVALACLPVEAVALPIQVDFTVSGFGAGAPDDPVSGTIVYEATGLNDPITSITSIALTISGHAYTLGEVGFTTQLPTFNAIGGLLAGVTGIGSGTIDFFFRWDRATTTGELFAYTAPGETSNFQSSNFTSFNMQVVPEPSTALLLASGLAVLAAHGRRRKLP